MHKSLFTFGLLASSLVMLGVTPLLNQNNSFLSNTAAMAQEYNDNSYSQYPTDDKKYECRTGPFEGFFTSSVEFCKFKFDKDDRKNIRDNRTGTQGLPGPQGPPGINGSNGAQGPPGITFLNGTNLYRVVGNVTVAEPGNFIITSFAECDSGDSPVNGFSVYFPFSEGNGTLAFTGTTPNNTDIIDLFDLPTGYLTSAIRPQVTDVVQSAVTCFDNPPLRP